MICEVDLVRFSVIRLDNCKIVVIINGFKSI